MKTLSHGSKKNSTLKETGGKAPRPVTDGNEKMQRTAYRELLDRYNRVLSNLHEAFFETDGSGKISFINESAERVTGYRAGELLGKDFALLLRKEERRVFVKFLTDILQDKRQGAIEAALHVKDGGINYFELKAIPIVHEGKITGMGLMARDLEEVKKIRDKLDEVKQKADETAGALKENIKELEEFALIAVRRELKMTEIRELLARYTGEVTGKGAARHKDSKSGAFRQKGAKGV